MQESDFNWFMANYNELYATYGRSFIAIKNERVLGAYKTFKDAVDITSETEQLGTFIVQECDGTESSYLVSISSMNFMD